MKILLFTLLCFTFTSQAQLVTLTDLTCEHLTNPIGIAEKQPRFSWKLAGEGRNIRQTAYEIRVATAADFSPKALVWSSGKIASDELTKGNQTHSTVTVNDARFKATGFAPITDFKTGDKPEATIDMTEIYDGRLTSLHRKFIKENNQSFVIEDHYELNDSTKSITWQLMTTADVEPTKNGAILKQDGKSLKMSILTPSNLNVSIISLSPSPLPYDKQIENLKRIEIRIPVYVLKEKKGVIKVRFYGN